MIPVSNQGGIFVAFVMWCQASRTAKNNPLSVKYQAKGGFLFLSEGYFIALWYDWSDFTFIWPPAASDAFMPSAVALAAAVVVM